MAHSPDTPSLDQENCNPTEWAIPLRSAPCPALDEALVSTSPDSSSILLTPEETPPPTPEIKEEDDWENKDQLSTAHEVKTECSVYDAKKEETYGIEVLSLAAKTLNNLSDFDADLLINFINQGMELRPISIYHYEFPDRNIFKLYFEKIHGPDSSNMQVFATILSAINNLKDTYDLTCARTRQPYVKCLAQRQLAWLALFDSIPTSMLSAIGPHEHVKTGVVIGAEVFSLGLLRVYAKGVVWILENLALGGPDREDLSDDSNVWFYMRRELDDMFCDWLDEWGAVQMWEVKRTEGVFIMADEDEKEEEHGEVEEKQEEEDDKDDEDDEEDEEGDDSDDD